jgi:hypothetical protein
VELLVENGFKNILRNLKEMDRFLDTYDHPKLNQEEINHLNSSITQNETEATIKSLPNLVLVRQVLHHLSISLSPLNTPSSEPGAGNNNM